MQYQSSSKAEHQTANYKFHWIGLLLLLCASLASAQTYVPMPTPKQQFFDNNGLPVAGGKLCTYAAGTTTPQATYADAIGTPNTNPVTLDSSGRAVVFFLNVSYKVTLQDSTGTPGVCDGAPIWTVDQVSSLAQLPAGGTVTSADTTVAFNATPTFTATAQVQLLRMTLTGNVTSSTFSAAGVTVPAVVTFMLTQDAVGGRTFAWPTNVFGGALVGTDPNRVTIENFWWDGTNLHPIGASYDSASGSGIWQSAYKLSLQKTNLADDSGSGGTWTFRSTTDNVVGAATTDTLTHKTYDTAGTGNVLKVNGTTVNAVKGNTSTVQLETGATTTNHFAMFDANGNTKDSGIDSTNTFGTVVYNTASSATTGNLGPTTMATAGGSGNTYYVQFYASETVIGTSCAGANSILAFVTYTDPAGAGTQNMTINAFRISAATGNGVVGQIPGDNTLTNSNPNIIVVKAGQTISYSTVYTKDGSCSPAPTYKLYPILMQVN